MSDIFHYMRLAIAEAQQAPLNGEIPVGAIIVHDNQVIAKAHNLCLAIPDPTAHAEILVLRQAAGVLKTPRLDKCTLHVTLEPCAMCAQALAFAHIQRIVFGAYDPKGGGIEHGARIFNQTTCHHRPEIIGGIFETECAGLLQRFFQARR